MNTVMAEDAWTLANRRLMSAEFARIARRIGSKDAAVDDAHLLSLRAAMPAPAAIDVVVERFDLTPFERDVLLLCAGMEMEPRIAARCAEVSTGARVAAPPFSLAPEILEGRH